MPRTPKDPWQIIEDAKKLRAALSKVTLPLKVVRNGRSVTVYTRVDHLAFGKKIVDASNDVGMKKPLANDVGDATGTESFRRGPLAGRITAMRQAVSFAADRPKRNKQGDDVPLTQAEIETRATAKTMFLVGVKIAPNSTPALINNVEEITSHWKDKAHAAARAWVTKVVKITDADIKALQTGSKTLSDADVSQGNAIGARKANTAKATRSVAALRKEITLARRAAAIASAAKSSRKPPPALTTTVGTRPKRRKKKSPTPGATPAKT